MQCANPECDATVDAGARVCPQCGMDLKPSVASSPSEDDDLGTEARAQAARSRRVRRLANASLILAILSCPLFLSAVLYALHLLHQWGLPFVGTVFPLFSHPWLFVVVVAALFIAPAAIVIGHIAIAKGRRLPRTDRVLWRPLFGTLLGYLTVVLITFLALSAANSGRRRADMAACGDNIMYMHVALRSYASENEGMFPPLSHKPGVLMISPEAIPPERFTDRSPFTCPTIRYAEKGTAGHKAARMETPPFDDQSYFYLGYAIFAEDDVEAFARAYRKQIAEGGTFDEDLVVKDGEGTRVIDRLSEDVLRPTQMRYSSPPYQSPGVAPTGDVPLLIERDLGHFYIDGGGLHGAFVLYYNSGLRFIERGTWPLTEKTQRILAELAE